GGVAGRVRTGLMLTVARPTMTSSLRQAKRGLPPSCRCRITEHGFGRSASLYSWVDARPGTRLACWSSVCGRRGAEQTMSQRDPEGSGASVAGAGPGDDPRTADELRRAYERSEAILASISDGFFVFDRDWRYVYANDAAVAQARRSRDELIGRSVWDIFPDVVDTEVDAQW